MKTRTSTPGGHASAAAKDVYYRRYTELKQRGESFFPYDIYRDIVMWLIFFAVLVLLAVFSPAPLEEVANPQSSSYVPRPEWYFLFLFQTLKYFPGVLEPVGSVILPGLLFGFLFALPWIDRSKWRSPRKRPVITAIGILIVLLLVGLTVLAKVEDAASVTPALPRAAVERSVLQDAPSA